MNFLKVHVQWLPQSWLVCTPPGYFCVSTLKGGKKKKKQLMIFQCVGGEYVCV